CAGRIEPFPRAHTRTRCHSCMPTRLSMPSIRSVGQNNGPGFAVYDTSDCRHPVLLADIQLPGSQGHMGAFAPDGRTYYLTQSFRGIGGFLYIVDLIDPSNPQMLPPWQFLGDVRPHGLALNPHRLAHGV